MPSKIEVKNISVKVGECFIVEPVDISLNKAEFCFLLGPNGSGKSSLLKAIAGIRQANLTVSQESSSSLSKAFLPQEPEKPQNITVRDYFHFSRYPQMSSYRELSPKEFELLEEILNDLKLKGFEERKLGGLSGGEWKKVCIASVIFQGADLIILDEPFQALDQVVKAEVAKFLNKWRKLGRSFLIASHDLFWSYHLCDKVIFLKRGHLLFEGGKSDTFHEETLAQTFDIPFNKTIAEDGSVYFSPSLKGIDV